MELAAHRGDADARLPSFGKELFLGSLRLDLIYPPTTPDRDSVRKGEQFLAQLREFLEREVDPMQIERDAKIPQHVLDRLKSVGALGMQVPEEYGGLGLSFVYYVRALMLVSSWHSTLATML